MKKNKTNNPSHIVLTSHPPKDGDKLPKVEWSSKTLKERGPLNRHTINGQGGS